MRELKSGKYYTTLEDTIKKYDLPPEATEAVKETIQATEDEFLFYLFDLT